MAEETPASAASEAGSATDGGGPNTLLVALVLCLVCSITVSSIAVALRGRQVANQENDRKKVILQVAGLYEAGRSIEELFEQVKTRVVELETGQYVDEPDFDQRKAARDPERSIAIPPEQDVAKIRRRARHASVYLVERDGQLDRVILPVHGYGLWSTMYGFVALERDANTIFSVQFYEHAETAGLGARVADPAWVGQFQGKQVYDEQGAIRVRAVKGHVEPDAPGAKYEVDGISGATLTSDGVSNLMRYWFSDQGFEPYLKRVGS